MYTVARAMLLEAFEEFVQGRTGAWTALAPEQGLAAVADFYEAVRVDGCVPEDGDMLLLQWHHRGTHVFVDFTRQIIDGYDDDGFWQLSLSFAGHATVARNDWAGDKWFSGPDAAKNLRLWARGLSAFQTICELDVRVGLDYVEAG